MNKKYLSVVLFGALLAASAGTFTSCKDYDDDIKGLQEQIDKSGSTVSDLQNQLTTLKAAAEAAQKAADDAKAAAAAAQTAADAAKAAGDDAAAKAAEAKVLAEEAKAAAATAKAEAIAEATKQVTALQTLMEQAIALKVDQSVFDAAILAVNAQIKAIDENLSKLAGTVEGIDAKVATNTSEIADAKKAIETLIAADANLQTQLDQLKAYAEATQGLAEDNQAKIEAAEAAIEASQAEIAELWKGMATVNGQLGSLATLIGDNTSLIEALTSRVGATEAEQAAHKERIAALESGLELAQSDITTLFANLDDTNQAMSAMENRIDGELDAVRGDISGIQASLTTIDGQIRDINADLAGLHVLIVSRLSSISFAPDFIVDGVEAIKFSSLIYTGMVADENALIPSTNYKLSTAAPAIASYHFNPATFNLANADYGYIDRAAEVITTRAAASNWVQIIGAPVANAEQGTVDFKLLRLNANIRPAENKTNLVALQAMLKGDAVDKGETGAVVTGDYVAIYDALLDADDVRIADKKTLVSGKDKAHYATTIDECAKLPTEYITYEAAYDKVFNLKELVATCYGNGNHDVFPIEDYSLSYKFSVAKTAYKIETGETVTDQQDWFDCNDSKEGLFQAKNFNKELIGRTPIVKIELVDNAGRVVRRAFVKLIIVADKYEDLQVGTTETLTYGCAGDDAKFEISEQFIRDNVYRVITNGKETSMSHEEFWNLYDASIATATITKNGKAFIMSSKPAIVDGATSVGVATKKVTWNFKHGELGDISTSGSTFVASITVNNKLASSEFPAKVTFTITVDVNLPSWSWAGTENAKFWENNMYLAYVSIPPLNIDEENADACVFRTSLTQAYVAGSYKVTGLPECVDNYYEVIATVNDGKTSKKGEAGFITGVVVDDTDITLTKNNPAVEKALNSKLGLQALVAHKYKLESGDIFTVNTFTVNFIRPVNLNMPSSLKLTDAQDGSGQSVDFQWNGLLTDWRGYSIVNKVWESVIDIESFWKINCAPEAKVIPGYQRVVTAAEITPEYGTVEFTTNGATTVYKATATYKYTRLLSDIITKEFTTGESYLTKEQAAKMLEYQAKAYNAGFGYNYAGLVDINYIPESIPSGTLVKYEYVKGIKYTPAVYEDVPARIEMVKHTEDDHTEMPSYDGSSYGETSGCWTWTKLETDNSHWAAGKYWEFYGQFGDVQLSIKDVYTNIDYNGNKLPNEGITLTQVGNTLQYINAGAKVTSPYIIYIPASIRYGWGTAHATLTVTVNPVN